jgi:tetratricopeptide (TPR) repeat protein
MADKNNYQDENFLAILDQSIKIPQAWTRFALTHRAADYFVQARKPWTEWKELDDLNAQLAEFDLRCASGDYNTAAYVLSEIDSGYLVMWGHFRLVIDRHLALKDKITDLELRLGSFTTLGGSFERIGKTMDARYYYQQGLKLAQESKNRFFEGVFLSDLGGNYRYLGELNKSLDYYDQALIIYRELDNTYAVGNDLGNLGLIYMEFLYRTFEIEGQS